MVTSWLLGSGDPGTAAIVANVIAGLALCVSAGSAWWMYRNTNRANRIADEANSIARDALQFQKEAHRANQRRGIVLDRLRVKLRSNGLPLRIEVRALNDSAEPETVTVKLTYPSHVPMALPVEQGHDWNPQVVLLHRDGNGAAVIPANEARPFEGTINVPTNPDVVRAIPSSTLKIVATTATGRMANPIDGESIRQAILAALGQEETAEQVQSRRFNELAQSDDPDIWKPIN